MITTKQRARLRGLANPLETIILIGKGGITENTVAQTGEALSARELIKMSCLNTSPCTAREAAVELAEKTGADVVQVIGSRFVLFKRNKEKPQIEL